MNNAIPPEVWVQAHKGTLDSAGSCSPWTSLIGAFRNRFSRTASRSPIELLQFMNSFNFECCPPKFRTFFAWRSAVGELAKSAIDFLFVFKLKPLFLSPNHFSKNALELKTTGCWRKWHRNTQRWASFRLAAHVSGTEPSWVLNEPCVTSFWKSSRSYQRTGANELWWTNLLWRSWFHQRHSPLSGKFLLCMFNRRGTKFVVTKFVPGSWRDPLRKVCSLFTDFWVVTRIRRYKVLTKLVRKFKRFVMA